MTVSSFRGRGLPERLLRTLPEANCKKPTRVHLMAIPEMLDGAAMLGIAQTRSGKAAAFTLPYWTIWTKKTISRGQGGNEH